jgi:hypothetical protein
VVMRWILLVLLAMTLLASCNPVVPIPADSGIQGQVSIGPLCPVMQVGVPCPDRPYQATLTVLTPERRRVARFLTDPQGHFRYALSPGSYILHPESPGVMPHAAEVQFKVLPGQFTQLAISYDSGIR